MLECLDKLRQGQIHEVFITKDFIKLIPSHNVQRYDSLMWFDCF